ncbi:MAG: serine hydrolase [Bacteroidetes bacterium]|nr:serine hydrolase [Bacteroidota bacterium]
MIFRLLLGSISIHFLLIVASCQPSGKADEAMQSLTDSLYAAQPAMHGLLLSVSNHDSTLVFNAGWADSTDLVPLEKNTPVLLASITKMYMAAATLRLCEKYHLPLDTCIEFLLMPETDSLLRADGYATNRITLGHLLNNTSGISDYTETRKYQEVTLQHPEHIWSRREQVYLAVSESKPMADPGIMFHYSDLNFLLLGELMEHFTQKPFYQSVRELLQFENHGLRHTWWNELEEAPDELPPLAKQYARSFAVDSWKLHPSFDLFGGGGIAATARDLARFTEMLFQGAFFSKPETLSLLTKIASPLPAGYKGYRLGVMSWEKNGKQAFGHGGFWGAMAIYYPENKQAICVIPLERDYWSWAQDIAWKIHAEEIY